MLMLEFRFRWVSCQLEALRRCLTTGSIRRVLEALPATLDETYDQILLGILEEHRQKALSALTWLTVSERPLTLAELAEACVIDNNKDPAFDPEERLLDPSSILNILSSLVSSQGHDGMEIRLAHFSVKEYLTSDRISRGPASGFRITEHDGNNLILQSCIQYIHCIATHDAGFRADPLRPPPRPRAGLPQELSTNDRQPSGHQTSAQNTVGIAALLRYASEYWPSHARHFGNNLPLAAKKLVVSFLLSPNGVGKWISSSPIEKVSRIEEEQAPPALYLAAAHGLSSVVEDLLQAGIDVNEQTSGTAYSTALQAACVSGDENFVSKLLAHNADVNIQGGRFGNALQAAAFGGHDDIVGQLLFAGADANASGGAHHSALQAAASSPNRNPAVVLLLLSHGAPVERDEKIGGLILNWAATLGYDAVVEAVLDNMPDPHIGDNYRWTSARAWSDTRLLSYISMATAPYEAALNGKEEVVKLFLNTWNNVDETDYEGRTALYWATFHGHIEIMKLLLHHGADLHCIGPFGWTAKYWASWHQDPEHVELLESVCQTDSCDICLVSQHETSESDVYDQIG